MSLRQLSWLTARFECTASLHRRLRSTKTLLSPILANRLWSYDRLYSCPGFSGKFCLQYRADKNAIAFRIPTDFVPVSVRGMAGHSKWQNIRHIKGAKDKQKSDMSSRFAQRLRLAVKEGGNDPKFNNKLERIIAEAKKADMTTTMIENAIKSGSEMQSTSSIAEVKFIGNCVLVVEIFSNKLQLVRNEIQSICKKHGGRIENGCSESIFDKKGIIHVATTNEPNLETALELAIEVGAEDVSVESDEDNAPFLQFICGPRDLEIVRKALEVEHYNVTYSEYEYLPNLTYPLDANGIAILEKLVNRLYQHQDVVKIFDNAVQLE